MQRSIGRALALVIALALASPAAAAEEWWYAGAVEDGGHLYADANSVERYGDEASIDGVILFPLEKDGLYFFEGEVSCTDEDGFYISLQYPIGEAFKTEEFLMMKDSEAALTVPFACSEPSQWPALGFKPTSDPVTDVFARARAQ